MCCDGCDKWVYVSCDEYLTEDVYDFMVQNPSDPWFCSICIVDHKLVSPHCHLWVFSGSKLHCFIIVNVLTWQPT